MKKHTITLLLVSLMAFNLIFTSVPNLVWADELPVDSSLEVLDNPEYSNEVNEPGAPAELIPDTPAEPNTNELGQTPDGLELPVPEEENDLLTACRLLNQQPCTLTLYRDLTVPGPFYVQNGIALTIQSEQNQKYTLSLKKVSPVTPSDEEISDITQGSNLILKNLTLDGKENSRGIHVQDNCTFYAYNCTFQNFIKPNEKVNGGMAIMAENSKSLILQDCFFINNDAKTGPAGALGILNVEDCRLTNVQFTKNKGKSAGAIQIEGTRASLHKCLFESNSTPKGQGGALYIANGSEVTITASQFTDNTASDGGAICIFPVNNKTIKKVRHLIVI